MRLLLDDTWVHAAGDAMPRDLPQAEAQALLRAPRSAHVPVQGTVYGVLHNAADALQALGERSHAAPYKTPPRAPVLYVKPRNTLIGHGDPVVVPAGAAELHVGAAVGAVIGRTASRVSEADALAHVAGYTLANDVTIPHEEFYRPSLRLRVRDGFCPIGPWVRAARHVGNPDRLTVRVSIDGAAALESTTAGFVRPLARLLADVTEFMTLQPGDVLLTGVAFGGTFATPRARAGQHVAIEVDGIGRLENPFVQGEPA